MPLEIANYANRYDRDGFVSPIPFFSALEATDHRQLMEDAEARIGDLHYKAKVHTILRSPFEMASHRSVLDVVESLIGPDILIYNVEYIVKEPHTESHVSWHQDLTYWGFDSDKQVSMWLALSPATEESGCMRMVPGSHIRGMMDHEKTQDETNVLFQGQTVHGVDEKEAVLCPLQQGEASFHHGWTLHASMPNRSDNRRIGLSVQYIRPSMKQLKHDGDSAVLVRGKDRYNHFKPDVPADIDLDPAALAKFEALNKVHQSIVANGNIAS
jgi:hypothetical protein